MGNSKEVNFEEAMNSLDLIVKELEEGNLSLDDSVSKFEEGMKLSKKCSEILEQAEKRISILIKKEDEVVEEKFISEE